jgi:microcin C transport system substrate-binding protein
MPTIMRFLSLLVPLAASAAVAQTRYPAPVWKDAPDPVASPHAVVGGTLSSYAGQYPPSFNYYLANNTFCAELFGLMYETLLEMDAFTLEYTPGLAAQWTLSDDKRTFTFTLDPRAVWSDGRPVTAEDVRWTYDTILDPRHTTGPHKVALERFEPPVVQDEHTVIFTARKVHWENLGSAGGFHILPKHAFEGMDFNKINFAFPVVSGPYRLGAVREGIALQLERRGDWWRRDHLRFRGTGNFQTLDFLFYAERENAFEAFQQGLIDIYPVHTARLWVSETRGERYLNNWIVKQTIQNHQPIGFQGFAMNMRRAPFNDIRVRQALAHLLNRERMNRTLMHNQYFLHRSYFEDLYSREIPCETPVFDFNPEKARELLAGAGWQANPATGLLEKDGKPLAFTFLTSDPTADNFLQIYNEDLQNAGIRMSIDRKDWAAWAKAMDEFGFDMTWAAWGAGLFKDPESMWHSTEAERTGGNNITGFRNEEADRLIEAQKAIFDVQERHAICRRIDAIATRECPYILLWNLNASRLLYWNKFGTPPTVLSKHGSDSAARTYWWFDEDSAADLKDAMETKAALPPRPPSVVFDDAFRPPAAP